jgi:signal peptidase I
MADVEPRPSEPPVPGAGDPVLGEPAATEPAPPAPPPPSKRSAANPFIELVIILAVAFGLAYVVQAWVVKPYRIPTGSMEPTLDVGDRVLVNRLVYRFHGPHRGDIIVFHPPGHGDIAQRGATTEASVTYIKRVIGLPGETLTITHGIVSVCEPAGQNCRSLRESYTEGVTGAPSYGPYTVPKNDYFVMGDNRSDSLDSRYWGPLPRHNIIGEAFLIYWPPDRLGIL